MEWVTLRQAELMSVVYMGAFKVAMIVGVTWLVVRR